MRYKTPQQAVATLCNYSKEGGKNKAKPLPVHDSKAKAETKDKPKAKADSKAKPDAKVDNKAKPPFSKEEIAAINAEYEEARKCAKNWGTDTDRLKLKLRKLVKRKNAHLATGHKSQAEMLRSIAGNTEKHRDTLNRIAHEVEVEIKLRLKIGELSGTALIKIYRCTERKNWPTILEIAIGICGSKDKITANVIDAAAARFAKQTGNPKVVETAKPRPELVDSKPVTKGPKTGSNKSNNAAALKNAKQLFGDIAKTDNVSKPKARNNVFKFEANTDKKVTETETKAKVKPKTKTEKDIEAIEAFVDNLPDKDAMRFYDIVEPTDLLGKNAVKFIANRDYYNLNNITDKLRKRLFKKPKPK